MIFQLIELVLQKLINFIGLAIELIVKILPTSPVQAMLGATGSFGEFLGVCNYFIPISGMLAITQAWLVAVGLYYIYSVWLRFLNMIE